jgi:serine/threonine-protein kinase
MLNDPTAWAALSPYLDQVLDLEPDARATWLDELSTTQSEVANSLRKLLDERDALNNQGFLLGSPLPLARLDTIMPALEGMLRQRVRLESTNGLRDHPNFAQSVVTVHRPESFSAGAILGPYRLLREIGHGGMSSVWLAERCDGHLKRDVALKLPFAGPRHAQMAERFKRERDILATLTHPNIARLYDAGISASGQSYLAMEYVDGTTLTHYCDSARLTIRERLKVFLQVLAAVEFAHTQLVLHRDLKPSNILVTEAGRVVLLDFGIAKLLSPDAAAESPLTEMAARILTPDYASPEHIAGSALGTTADVYSLGVVLYELLAGGRPFGREHASRRQLEEAILTQDPPRPSQSIPTDEATIARCTTPRKLAQALRGDLDTIVLKSLKKEPNERYRSIDAFARDITNHLGNLPVSARPDSAWYRSRRFVSRYKWQVTAVTVILLMALIGGTTVVWQARATAEQRDLALALASRNRAISDFMSMLIGEAASSEKPVTAKEMLARSESLALVGTAGNGADRAAIMGMIADLHISAGDVGKSVQVLEHALQLAGDAHDKGLRARLTCLHAMAIAHTGKAETAISTISRELDNLQSDHVSASSCLNNLAQVAQWVGDADGALRYATAALKRSHQSGLNTSADEGVLLGSIAMGHRLKGDNALADSYYERAMKKYAEAGRERSPDALVTLNNWALVSTAAGVPKRALERYDEILSTMTAHDPTAAAPPALITNRARVLHAVGRFAQAKLAYEQALQLASRSNNVADQGAALLGLAALAEQLGDRAAAAQYLDEYVKTMSSSLASRGPSLVRRTILQGRLDLAAGKLDQARAQFDAVLGANGQKAITSTRNYLLSNAAVGKAEADLLSGNAPAAVTDARAALDIAISLQGGVPYSNHTGNAWLMLGRALQAHGELEPAHRAFESAVTHLSNTVDADHPELVRARQLAASTTT